MKSSIVIGRFRRSDAGGWEGDIDTLAIRRHIRLVPNDDRMSDTAPAFRVMLGWQHVGDAWERRSHGEPPRDYLRVVIRDPHHPIAAVLFPGDDGVTARLCCWSGGQGGFAPATHDRGGL